MKELDTFNRAFEDIVNGNIPVEPAENAPDKSVTLLPGKSKGNWALLVGTVSNKILSPEMMVIEILVDRQNPEKFNVITAYSAGLTSGSGDLPG